MAAHSTDPQACTPSLVAPSQAGRASVCHGLHGWCPPGAAPAASTPEQRLVKVHAKTVLWAHQAIDYFFLPPMHSHNPPHPYPYTPTHIAFQNTRQLRSCTAYRRLACWQRLIPVSVSCSDAAALHVGTFCRLTLWMWHGFHSQPLRSPSIPALAGASRCFGVLWRVCWHLMVLLPRVCNVAKWTYTQAVTNWPAYAAQAVGYQFLNRPRKSYEPKQGL